MLKGFKDFILRGNMVELAVAVVIGVAFAAVVNSMVTNLITPPDRSGRRGPQLLADPDRAHPVGQPHQRRLGLFDHGRGRLLRRGLANEPRAGADEALRAAPAAHAGVPGVPERHPPGGATVRLLHGRGSTGGHGAAADGVAAHGC